MSGEMVVAKQSIAVQNRTQAVERLRASLEDVVTIRSNWLDDKREEHFLVGWWRPSEEVDEDLW